LPWIILIFHHKGDTRLIYLKAGAESSDFFGAPVPRQAPTLPKAGLFLVCAAILMQKAEMDFSFVAGILAFCVIPWHTQDGIISRVPPNQRVYTMRSNPPLHSSLGWQRPVAALLATLVCAALGLADRFPPDPVEELREALRGPAPKDLLISRIEAIRSLGDLRRALALQDWGSQTGGLEELAGPKLQGYLFLVQRFKKGVDQTLKEGTSTARLAVMAMLAEMGPSVRSPAPEDQKGIARTFAPDLAALIKSNQTPQIKEAAARTLGLIYGNPDVAVPALREMYGSPNVNERRAAAEGLAALMRTVGQQTFRSELVTAPVENRKELIQDITRAITDVVPLAGRGLSDPVLEVRRLSAEAIVQAGAAVSNQVGQPRAGEEIGELPGEQARFEEARLAIVPAMEVFAKQAAALERGLKDPDSEIRTVIGRALEELGGARQRLLHGPAPSSAPAVPPEQGRLRGAQLGRGPLTLVAMKLQATAPPDPLFGLMQSLLPTLEARVRDPNVQVRLEAINVLETLETSALPAVPALVQALYDPNLFVRWAAARTLGKMGPVESNLVVPGLAHLLFDSDLDVRLAAAVALERIGPAAQAAVPDLIRATQASDEVERQAAIRALGGIGTGAKPAIPALAAALSDPEPRVRQTAAEVLGRFGPSAASAEPALRKALNDPDPDVRRAASDALLNVLGNGK
jgi:HEAT repeat protein